VVRIDEMESLRERVAERLAALDINAFEAARKAGLERGFINDILQGKKHSVRGHNLVALAEVLQCDVGYLAGSLATPRGFRMVTDAAGGHLPLVGTVEAGTFREPDLDGPAMPVAIPTDPDYPATAQAAYRVAGDSMNIKGVEPGMVLATIDADAWVQKHGRIADGRLVVVKRIKGGNVETSIKELRRFEDRIELAPRSTNPKHRPIVIPPPDDETVSIVAVVTRASVILGG
jgi:SOS-response transcriptional repressor LexA